MPRKPSQSPVEHHHDIKADEMPQGVIPTGNASCGAPDDGPATVAHDSSALLGLEPADTEKVGENSPVEVEATRSPPLAPLLGTISSHSVETASGIVGTTVPAGTCLRAGRPSG